MNTADALATLAKAGLANVTGDLQRLVAPSIRATTSKADEASLAVGASKLGGQPDMPLGTAWPVKTQPLSFVGQIKLDDLRAFDAARALPASGLLSFFYDATQQTFGDDPNSKGNWQVLYFPANAGQLQRVSAPTGMMPAGAQFTACALSFAEEPTLPQQPELEIPTLRWTDAEKSAYDAALPNFPAANDHTLPHNRLLGHPNTIQDDMRMEVQVASHGLKGDDPKAAALQPGAMNWRLLFQVDSDPNAGMRWASSGMLYYWIEDAALKAQRFED
ncbi:MAG TPA: YwqG family protein, partial [Ktedonobacterales bacterium]